MDSDASHFNVSLIVRDINHSFEEKGEPKRRNEPASFRLPPGQACSRVFNICFLVVSIYVPCIYHMPGGVIVGDSGLCYCVPVSCVTSIVREHYLSLLLKSRTNLSESVNLGHRLCTLRQSEHLHVHNLSVKSSCVTYHARFRKSRDGKYIYLCTSIYVKKRALLFPIAAGVLCACVVQLLNKANSAV